MNETERTERRQQLEQQLEDGTTNNPQEPDYRWTRPDFILGYIATTVSMPGIGEDRVIELVRYALIMHAKATGSLVLAAVLGVGDDPQT